ncbi:AraC family transcriptional regulator [Nocardia paucivorans]|uniref:AraC family transcriptional regulator n=1 Tax=Nocardia paucivorans TaxID=114259 RepID=UPI0002FCB5C6|nr:AraC family transcriptional regulator [Nocardia paucivorans]
MVRHIARDAVTFPATTVMSSCRMAELRDAVQQVTVVHDVQVRAGAPDGLVATARVGALDVAYVRYGARVAVDAFPTHNRFALTVPLGPMQVSETSLNRSGTLRRAFVLSHRGHTLMDPHPTRGALIFAANTQRLEEHLTTLTGRPPARPLRFFPPGDGTAVGPVELVDSGWRLVYRTLAGAGGHPLHTLVTRQLEDTLLSAVLLGLPHTNTDDLRAGDIRPCAGLADRARRWIEEHYAEPVTVTDVARAVGVGVRQLQLVFRERFDSTPTEMLRTVRLEQARRLLCDTTADLAPTVTTVAYGCGFTHLGRFALAYRVRFGESPSDTLRRIRHE